MFHDINTEPSSLRANDLGLEHHKPNMSMRGGNGGRLDIYIYRERERDREKEIER